jgi:histidyl-tRNA synthetase
VDLDDATRERAGLNPLRILDDKREGIQSQLTDAPVMVDHLCLACSTHYDDVREYLRVMGVDWKEAPRMVRGLDYYTRTTFEFTHHLLGAQSGIGGGGRYDGLMASIGGDDLSGIGFGLGTDRTLLACEAEGLEPGAAPHLDVVLVPIGKAAKARLVSLSVQLRGAGIRNDLAYGDRGLKGAMKAADRSGAPLVVVVGDAEVESDIAQVKTMSTGEQATVSWPDLISFISLATERDIT